MKVRIRENKKGGLALAEYQPVEPFLKWLGGKRWLMPKIKNILSNLKVETYIEPFLGGGAFYFFTGIQPAILADINGELINAYIQVRDNPSKIIKELKTIGTDRETYYAMRREKPKNLIARAVRFIYLNRTAFSGIYRVNNRGEFNVPFGNYGKSTEIIWRENLLFKASGVLKNTKIICSDFERIIDNAKDGDFIYCDPTYVTTHNNNGFRKYNEKCFSWSDQIRLASSCKKAALRGANVMISNACHGDLLPLYHGFEVKVIERKSILCPEPSRRKVINEYLFIKFVNCRDQLVKS